MKEETKRLFFGLEVHSPWPSSLPQGRLLDEKHRHLTLAFLGQVTYPPLRELLEDFPTVSFQVGRVGNFDSCLLLPPPQPHVVAWHAQFWEDGIVDFQKTLTDWLTAHQYNVDSRPWKPHVTLCREPFDSLAWTKDFTPLPFYTSSLHLYESTGNLNYKPRWSYAIKPPFEEVSHTADMAFIIRGETLKQIYHHAFMALAFKFPLFLNFFQPIDIVNSLDEVIIALNDIIARMDSAIGCSLKAVSFHGEVINIESILQWEMIVDV